jgi:membrane-associated PAP2 superfamily phosphatase
MTRTAPILVLLAAALIGATFALRPELDLHITQPFFDTQTDDFWLRHVMLTDAARKFTTILVILLAFLPVLALAARAVVMRSGAEPAVRAAVFLWSTLLLGPGLLVNMVLKQFGGRPRPIDTFEFAGHDYFVAWWDFSGGCPANCSFVSGEMSAAVWTLAPAALAPLRMRPAAYGAAIAFALFVGVQRLAAGAHFFTDVVFAGAFTFLIVWLAHELVYRKRIEAV